MIKVSDQAPLKDWALATYRNLTPEYVKATVLAGAIYHITNILLKPKGEVVVSWQELSRFYDDFYPHVPQELRPSESYRYLTRVLQNLPSNLNKINQQLRSFGIELLRKDGTIYLRYESDPKRLQNMTYLYNAVYQDNAVYQVPP
jgi:hypothetical protein